MKSPIDKYYATILLGAAELFGKLKFGHTFEVGPVALIIALLSFFCLGASLSILLVHWTGKRPLVFISLIGVAVCFFASATYAYFIDSIPGVAFENIVANYSTDALDRSSYINEQNLTQALSLTAVLETTTANSINGSNLITEVAPIFVNTSIDEKDTNKIFVAIPNAEKNPYSWIPMAFLIASGVFSHIGELFFDRIFLVFFFKYINFSPFQNAIIRLGIRITPWQLIGEVFPVNVRSAASGISSGVGYMFAFFANKLFLTMVSTLALSGTFWLYSTVAAVCCILFYFVLPETEGRTLIDIEEHFLGKKSLSERSLNKFPANQMNGMNKDCGGNATTNGIAYSITVEPQIDFKPPTNQKRINNGNAFMMNGSNSCEHRLSVPEILLTPGRQPRAGSKRYKHKVSDTIQSRDSIESVEDDVQDTHL